MGLEGRVGFGRIADEVEVEGIGSWLKGVEAGCEGGKEEMSGL